MIATIYHNNIEFIKCVNNHIISNLEYIKKIYIHSNEKDISLLENNTNINLAFTTYDMVYSHPNKINLLTEKFDYIIVLHSPQTITNLPNVLFVSIDYSCNIALNLIRKFILSREASVLINNVEKLLLEHYFEPKLIGTQYLIDGITYAYINNSSFILDNLQQNIYPYLSQIYNKSINSIKVAITHSIDNAIQNCYKNKKDKKEISRIINIINSPKTLFTEFVNILN